MASGNGSDRLDRMERLMNYLIERQADFDSERRVLMSWQVVAQERLDRIEAAVEANTNQIAMLTQPLDIVTQRLDIVTQRLDTVTQRLDQVAEQMKETDQRILGLVSATGALTQLVHNSTKQ